MTSDPGGDTDTSAVSRRVDGASNVSKKLRNTSEHVSKRSERKGRENSPSRPGEEQIELGGEMAVPNGTNDVQEHPRRVRNERVDETNAPRRRNSPGGHLGEPEASRGVEGVRDRGTVVDSAEHDGICPSNDGNERFVKTNARSRRTRPGGHMGEPKASRDVEGDWSRESDGDGVGYNGRRDGKNGATSSICCGSKRAETRLLAGDKGQYQQVERDITMDIPEASTPPPNDPKRPVEVPNPPRRRGQIKTQSKRVSQAKMKTSTYRIVRPCRGKIRRIEHIGDVECGVQMVGEYPRLISEHHDTAEGENSRSRAPGQYHTDCTRAATYHIW
jgi:hypothetical protein